MRRRMTMCWSAVTLAVLSLASATPASAQLGKLKKIAADAAKDAATGKKPDPVADATGSNSGGARVDYTVTEERLTGILAALAPQVEAAKQQAAADGARADYQARFKAANDCLTKAAAGGAIDASGYASPKGQALTERINAVNQRSIAANQGKRYREYAAAADTALVLQMQLTALLVPNAKCPAMPYQPAALIEESARKMDPASWTASSGSSSNELVVPQQHRANMTSGQFGRIREIVAIWALQQSGDLPASAKKFTDPELAVLNAHGPQIKSLTPLFKTNALQWATWGDIKSW